MKYVFIAIFLTKHGQEASFAQPYLSRSSVSFPINYIYRFGKTAILLIQGHFSIHPLRNIHYTNHTSILSTFVRTDDQPVFHIQS